jgi:hypothetical protein
MQKSGFELFEFFATFGHGQSGFPGYLRVRVYAEDRDAAKAKARARVNHAVGRKWCQLYGDLSKLHPADNFFRGDA